MFAEIRLLVVSMQMVNSVVITVIATPPAQQVTMEMTMQTAMAHRLLTMSMKR